MYLIAWELVLVHYNFIILLLQVVAMDDWKVETFDNGTRLKYEWYVYSDLICALLSSFQHLSTAISTVLLVTQYEPFPIISLSLSPFYTLLSCRNVVLRKARPPLHIPGAEMVY